MLALGRLNLSILLLLLLITLNSCALTETLTGKNMGPEVYYTIPPVTYVREFPGYASQNVGTVYHGDQVTVLSKMEKDWCRVQTSAGQQGWIQQALLSPVPLQVQTYYVQAAEIPLRPDPHEEVISRQILYRGDEVIKLSENEQDWWRVLVKKDKSLGWLPAASLAVNPPQKEVPGVAGKPSEKEALPESSPPSAPAPKQFFVAIDSLELHLLPLASSKVVKVLQFNDKVEEVYQSGPEWRKVKFPETGVQGWTQASYLSKSAAKTPRSVKGKKKKGPARPGRRDLKEEPILQPEGLDPEVM